MNFEGCQSTSDREKDMSTSDREKDIDTHSLAWYDLYDMET